MVLFWSFFWPQVLKTRFHCWNCPFLVLFLVLFFDHNEDTHFCREIVNTRFLRPFGVIMQITTKSPQKLYNGSFFGPFFTQKSFFSPLKSFWHQVLKSRFHLCKHWKCEQEWTISGAFWKQRNNVRGPALPRARTRPHYTCLAGHTQESAAP